MLSDRKYSPELIAHTIEVFSPKLGRTMTEEEAEDCIWRWQSLFKVIESSLTDDADSLSG